MEYIDEVRLNMKSWMSAGMLVLGLCLLLSHVSMAAEVYSAQIVDYGLYIAKDVKTKYLQSISRSNF
jgi:hypothetical protein